MKLGGNKKQTDFADVFGVSADAPPLPSASDSAHGVATAPVLTKAPELVQPKEPVFLTMEERMTIIVNRDGGLQQMEVKGDLMVHATTPEGAQSRIKITYPQSGEVQFKTHPNMDKKQWASDAVLTLKDSGKTFPLGQPTGVLKWRLVSKDEESLPISVNCWPNPTNDGYCEVNIEYDLLKPHMRMKNVTLGIPIPVTGNQPAVSHVDGDTLFDRQRNMLYWTIPCIDEAHASGSLDFKSQGDQPGGYFPVTITFASDTLYVPVHIVEVLTGNGTAIEFGAGNSCSPDEFKIV
jgi:hypothetical protein